VGPATNPSRRGLLAILALAGLGTLLGCGAGNGEEGASAAATSAQEPSAPPSPLAVRLLGADGVAAFRRVGEELGLDWAILAATSQIESAGRGAPTGAEAEERISGVGLTLQALGAPIDYESALRDRGGGPFAKRVLALAERLRHDTAAGLPAARPPFGVPVDGRVVSGFGKRYGALHDGIDIAAPAGEPVAAVAAGQVIATGFDPAYGNRTCVLHRVSARDDRERRLTSCYGNQERFEAAAGDLVEEGETIGIVGCSGPCLRPHVHLQILDGSTVSSRAVDPSEWLDVDDAGVGARFSLERPSPK
jgi:murein DD-endopeptidase MepM/ murein hydrolase activator NlpD